MGSGPFQQHCRHLHCLMPKLYHLGLTSHLPWQQVSNSQGSTEGMQILYGQYILFFQSLAPKFDVCNWQVSWAQREATIIDVVWRNCNSLRNSLLRACQKTRALVHTHISLEVFHSASFSPKYRLSHPKKYIFSLSNKKFSGSEHPKNISFHFEKRSTGVTMPFGWETKIRLLASINSAWATRDTVWPESVGTRSFRWSQVAWFPDSLLFVLRSWPDLHRFIHGWINVVIAADWLLLLQLMSPATWMAIYAPKTFATPVFASLLVNQWCATVTLFDWSIM